MRDRFQTTLLTIGFLLSSYVLAYFVLVHVDGGCQSMGVYSNVPGYRVFPRTAEIFFRPMHCLDRKTLRPLKWEYGVHRSEQIKSSLATGQSAARDSERR